MYWYLHTNALTNYLICWRLEEMKKLTIQSQHWRKVLAVRHTGGISHTCFPQVRPEGCCGDDCSVHRGHLPVVCRQSRWNKDPSWYSQEKCNNLSRHFAHVLWILAAQGLGQYVDPLEVAHKIRDGLSPLPVQQSICAWEPLLSSAYHSETQSHLL